MLASLNAASTHCSIRPHLSSVVYNRVFVKPFACPPPSGVHHARQHRPKAATDLFSNLIATACTGTSLVLISRELLTGRATERTLSGDDNFKWGLMGFISCIPVFNWLAWVLAAVDADNPRPYLLLAGLYGSTLLTNGFDLDGFTWTLLALGALHVQVARITATEPQLQQRLKQGLTPAALLTTSTTAARKAAEVVVGPQAVGGGQQQQQQEGLPAAGGSRRSKGKDVLFSDEELQEEREMAEQQLREFDRLLQQKQGLPDVLEPPPRAAQPRGGPTKRSPPEDDDW